MDHRDLLAAALGLRPLDLLVREVRLVNVHSGEIHTCDIGVVGDGIATVGAAEHMIGPDTRVMEGAGRYALPGFIDAHIHTYESHLPVTTLAVPMLERGVTTVATDFYGEAVVGGRAAVRASLDETADLPWNVLWTLPLPAHYQDAPFAHSGALDAGDMLEMLEWDECIGVNECFAPYVAREDPFLLEVMERARALGKALCGHASETTGDALMAWAAFGGYLDDHECVAAEEVRDKARLGVRIILREGSAARNVREGLRAVSELGVSPRQIAFCSDLLSPVDLVRRGNIDRCVRYAIAAGIDPVEAVRMGTLNAAEALGVHRWLGSVAPGKRADLSLLDGPLADVNVDTVVCGGQVVVTGGAGVAQIGPRRAVAHGHGTVRIPAALSAADLDVTTSSDAPRVVARVIGVSDGSIITEERHLELAVVNGRLIADPDRDIAKIAAVERHGGGAVGVGFAQGFGLRRGAIASTYNPHNQHLLMLGVDETDMIAAARTVEAAGGGFAVVDGGEIKALVPLPRYGLLSERPAPELVTQIEAALAACRELGCDLQAPFHTLAFTGLPVIIGRLKICSAGVVDVWAERTVSVEV